MIDYYRVSSVRDLETWANNTMEISDSEAKVIASAIWGRDDFPHPVNNTNIADYLNSLDTHWLWEVADSAEEVTG